MGYIPDDQNINFNFDLVDYSDYSINIEPPTPPPLPSYSFIRVTPEIREETSDTIPFELEENECESSVFDKIPTEVNRDLI
jgi:hypothetical protein